MELWQQSDQRGLHLAFAKVQRLESFHLLDFVN
jgi:hypothetical protein